MLELGAANSGPEVPPCPRDADAVMRCAEIFESRCAQALAVCLARGVGVYVDPPTKK